MLVLPLSALRASLGAIIVPKILHTLTRDRSQWSLLWEQASLGAHGLYPDPVSRLQHPMR